MLFSFRSKLRLVVVATILALLMLVLGSALIGFRLSNALDHIEGRLVPKAELGPMLESEFATLRHDLDEASRRRDRAALDATLAAKVRIITLITTRDTALDSEEAANLRWAIQDYYDAARNVADRVIANDTLESLTEVVEFKRQRELRARELIRETTSLSQSELAAGFETVRHVHRQSHFFRLALGLGAIVVVVALALWVIIGLLRSLDALTNGFSRFASGDFSRAIALETNDELGKLAAEANRMAESLRNGAELRERTAWVSEGRAELEDELRGDPSLEALTEKALVFLSLRVSAVTAGLYISDDRGSFLLRSSFAREGGADPVSTQAFRAGEGLLGQAVAREDVWVVDCPPGYLKVHSGLGSAEPGVLVFLPLVHLNKVVGIVELGFFERPSELAIQFLSSVRMALAIALSAAESRTALRELLAEAQRQAERLAAQEEELRVSNEELRNQQEELRRANSQLSQQRQTLSEQNLELEQAHLRVQQKADEIARVSNYKSQFVANMSHELRTPLNSMLVLSRLLADNESGNLTQRQVEHCLTVHSAGQDLLSLINQILDLAKIEAGRQELVFEKVELSRLTEHAERVFDPLAREKGVELVVEHDAELPPFIVTDRGRLERIVTNLLGNAVKFTQRGRVTLRVARADPGTTLRGGRSAQGMIAFSVTDTGIGIAESDRDRVFAPFEQVEAQTNRRYGGTGLGLAIARESAELLEGDLMLESTLGQGSTFTCFLPERPSSRGAPTENAKRTLSPERAVVDDRTSITPGEPHLLVIEDDEVIKTQLFDIIHARGFKAVLAATGEEGIQLARELRPHGIVLDVRLPDIDGWTVLERLRDDPATHGTPVHFMSAVDAPERGLALGAIGYLTKPASRAELAEVVHRLTPRATQSTPRVLVVEDNPIEGDSVVDMLSKEGFEARHVATAADAISTLEAQHFDCMILDLGLPDMDGLGLLETLSRRSDVDTPSVVVHTARALSKKETHQLEAYVETVVLKDGNSEARLLDEVRLFVGQLGSRIPAASPSDAALVPDVSLEGTKLLLAEDDMRTVYAISAVLQGKGAQVIVAETGAEALELLANNPDVDGVLMDIMMPEMDGYEAMRRLRADDRFTDLPVIALTAKAMKGERERCIMAGASEYLSKPVDASRLLSLLHRFLTARGSA